MSELLTKLHLQSCDSRLWVDETTSSLLDATWAEFKEAGYKAWDASAWDAETQLDSVKLNRACDAMIKARSAVEVTFRGIFRVG